MNNSNLSNEELELLNSLEADEWQSVASVQDEIANHIQYAKNTLKKDKRVSIRISSRDLNDIQTRAIEDGIPYQTLISSILHKFATGKLVEKQHIQKSYNN